MGNETGCSEEGKVGGKMSDWLGFWLCLGILFLVFFSHNVMASGNVAQTCLHSTDKEVLKKYAGSYIFSALVEAVKEKKIFFTVPVKTPFVDQISISEKGDINFIAAWHEGWSWDKIDEQKKAKECISVVDRNTLIFHSTEFIRDEGEKNIENQYTLIPYVESGRFFFNLIFQDCFKDSENKKWCFEDGENKKIDSKVNGKSYSTLSVDGNIVINGKKYAAEFILDRTELPKADVILSVEGEKLLWTFYKIENGWNVCKTEPVTIENYKTEPCKVLTRN